MEKNRYEVTYDGVIYDIFDNEIKQFIFILDLPLREHYRLLCDLLNQQDSKIKELEEENEKLKQSQNQEAIEELKSVKYNLLDLSNNFWRHFKTGEPFMTYEDARLFVRNIINIQIEELRSQF